VFKNVLPVAGCRRKDLKASHRLKGTREDLHDHNSKRSWEGNSAFITPQDKDSRETDCLYNNQGRTAMV